MFKFSIRDVLLLTVIAAVATAWAIDHYRQAREIESLSALLTRPADLDFVFTWEETDEARVWKARSKEQERNIDEIEKQLDGLGIQVVWVCYGDRQGPLIVKCDPSPISN